MRTPMARELGTRHGNKAAKLLAFLSIFMIGFGISTATAVTRFQQDGRHTGSNAVDGSQATITANKFGVQNAGQCVIYSNLVLDQTGAGRQLQNGLVRCASTSGTIDGTCPSGHEFIERFNGTNYYCSSGNSFANGSPHFFQVARTSANSTTMRGYISQNYLDQGGYNLTDSTYGLTWAEAAGTYACPGGPHSADFNSWSRKNSDTWFTVTSSSQYHYSYNTSGSCWTVGSIAGGDYSVY
jgi:hypothetical protein